MPYKNTQKQKDYDKERKRLARRIKEDEDLYLSRTERVGQDRVGQDGRTEDQRARFPAIPLPFGKAYYEALARQRADSHPIPDYVN